MGLNERPPINQGYPPTLPTLLYKLRPCFVKADCTALHGPIRNEACLCKSFLLVLLRYSILVKQIERALPKKSFETGLATLRYFSLLLQAAYYRREIYGIKRKKMFKKAIENTIHYQYILQ